VAKNEDDLIRTRATLLGRLKNWEDQASWQEFFDIYWQPIYRFARKAGLSDAEAQDVVQETMFAVSKQMPGFEYNPAIGTFKAWLLNLVRWRITDQFRKRGPMLANDAPPDDSTRTATLERIADEKNSDWTAMWEIDWQKAMYAAAMDRVKPHLDPRKFQIFDFYVNHEWPPEKVALTFNVAVNQVYLVKNRVTEMLRDEVHRLEREIT
jgi:RNA polymerase sigma-70 factor (ECF subfamily)